MGSNHIHVLREQIFKVSEVLMLEVSAFAEFSL